MSARTVARQARVEVAGVSVSNPARVVFAVAGLTKLDLVRYQESVAEQALPHLRGRPLTLVRCGAEIAQGCMFLKHSKVWAPATPVELHVHPGCPHGFDRIPGLPIGQRAYADRLRVLRSL